MASYISIVFCALATLTIVSAYAGEYIPKSYYIIANGHKSELVNLRSKRSVLHLLRKRRSNNIPGVPSPEQFYAEAQEFLNRLPHGDFYFPQGFNAAAFQGRSGGTGGGGSYGYGSGSGSGAYSFSGASASGGGGGGPQGRTYSSGSGNNHHYSNVGPDGPRVFSRFGEADGNNIQVSGSASGPNGAYSSSSASSDGSGKVRYSVQSGKY